MLSAPGQSPEAGGDNDRFNITPLSRDGVGRGSLYRHLPHESLTINHAPTQGIKLTRSNYTGKWKIALSSNKRQTNSFSHTQATIRE